MAKALKPLIAVLLGLSIVALILGIVLFSQRDVLKGRTQKHEQAVVRIASNLHAEGLDPEKLKDYGTMDKALDFVAVSAENRYQELQDTKTDLATTREELTQTKTDLAATKTQLEDAQARIGQLADNLEQKEAELAQANGRVTQLEQDKANLQITIDDLNTQLVRTEEEVRELQDRLATLDNIIKDLEIERGDRRYDVPQGLTGRIMVVNPDWNFVVLNIGSEEGLVPTAEMLVHRGEQFIGKVRVSRVQKTTAIAEIMLDWAQAPLSEGDYVLF